VPPRHVARNFDRGGNSQVSKFDYLIPLVVEASSIKGAFFWNFFCEYYVQIKPTAA